MGIFRHISKIPAVLITPIHHQREEQRTRITKIKLFYHHKITRMYISILVTILSSSKCNQWERAKAKSYSKKHQNYLVKKTV